MLLVFVILHENKYLHSAWLEIFICFRTKTIPSEISIDSEEDSMLGGFSYVWGVCVCVKISGTCNVQITLRKCF